MSKLQISEKIEDDNGKSYLVETCCIVYVISMFFQNELSPNYDQWCQLVLIELVLSPPTML